MREGGAAHRLPFVSVRRRAFLGVVAATTLAGLVLMLGIVRAGGISLLEVVILALFAPTFAWIAVAFWTAVAGFLLRLLGRDPLTLRPILRDRRGVPVHPLGEGSVPDARPASAADDPTSPARILRGAGLEARTALVMPAYNEDPRQVVRGLAATLDSLAETGHLEAFDLFLLSDSTDPEVIEAEEAAWEGFLLSTRYPERLHYRRRTRNTGRKAGNVAEFLDRRGNGYELAVVLDADSVMSGSTLVELVRIMEANPGVGLLQTVPVPARQQTLFGRLLQFAATVHSPVLATGQSFWLADAANYWGHNAIFRTAPFREHCRLPVLPGAPPLGGEILSHDFVEAALLRRAGWEVLLVPELEGSYEEVPNNLLDYARRDRRWAQGSLQHLRLLTMPGLHPLSRWHFLMGAMGYLSSCLWLLMLVAGTAYVLVPASHGPTLLAQNHALARLLPDVGGDSWISLLVVTGVILFLPKLLALVLTLAERPGGFGGRTRLAVSGLLETLFSALIAPLMMLYHAWFVLGVLLGRNVVWTPQARGRRGVPWTVATRETAAITAIGAGWAGLTVYASWGFFLWLTPILVGLVLAAPVVRWTSSDRLGDHTRRLGLFLVPTEIDGAPPTSPVRTPERLGEAPAVSGPVS